MALCFDALALILLPSSATWPSFTRPAARHKVSTWTNSASSAARWRFLKWLMVRKSGRCRPVTAITSTRSSQATAIRLEA